MMKALAGERLWEIFLVDGGQVGVHGEAHRRQQRVEEDYSYRLLFSTPGRR